ncbi:hypothetical protein [Brevibacillus sp. AF8]|uniref:hypothetical protein n=1 Tax=Brevibacillus sp. AF8 TaxID=2825881 RepID=UPI001E38D7F7|nr:hypothetical protein [Brevibacillus sp. AF8]MCE0450052.1 hypothetical protein [Brevibacillus sp. AF8]
MDKDFAAIDSLIKTSLTYSELFGTKTESEEIIKEIRSYDLDEALSILSQFTVLNKESIQSLKQVLYPHVIDKSFVDRIEPFDTQSLMYAMKWFIAYGTRNPVHSLDNGFDVTFNMLLTVLKIADHMFSDIDDLEEIEDMVIKGSLFVRNTDLDRSLLRQYIMFEELARDSELFEQNDFIDIHRVFEDKYGYTIQEYVSTVFSLNLHCVKGRSLKEVLSDKDWGIDTDQFFEKVSIKDKAMEIYKDLCIEPLELREWAMDSLKNPFDYELLLTKPIFINDRQGKTYPCSAGNMNANIFDGLFFKIRNCFPKHDTSFFAFFGRLFENYIADTLKKAVSEARIKEYKFIEEFSYGKMNKKSSDAHIRIGQSLLIVEGKSGRIRKETKIEANERTTVGDFRKYVVEPIEQANEAYSAILQSEPDRFRGVKKVYILSVSSHTFPKVPKYNDLISDKHWLNSLHYTVKKVDYLGLIDLEVIALAIKELDTTIFRFIDNKKTKADYIPYSNYYFNKYGKIKRLESHDKKLKEIFRNINVTLGFKNSDQ